MVNLNEKMIERFSRLWQMLCILPYGRSLLYKSFLYPSPQEFDSIITSFHLKLIEYLLMTLKDIYVYTKQ